MMTRRASCLLLVGLTLFATTVQATLETDWSHQLYDSGELEKGVKEFGQPIFSEDGSMLLVGGRDGYLWAFETETKKVLWKRKFTNRLVAQPSLVSENRALIADTGGSILLIDLSNGADIWSTTIQTQGSFHGRLLVHGPTFSALDSANRLVSGTLEGRFLFDIGQREGNEFTLFSEPTPATDGKALFVGFSNGTIASVHPVSGKLNWERELPHLGGKIRDAQAGPIVIGDNLLVGGPGTGLHLISKDNGQTLSQLKINGLTQLIRASENSVYALTWKGEIAEVSVDSAKTLKIKWSNDFPGVASPAALTTHHILFCNGSGIISLSRGDGSIDSYRTLSEGCASGVTTRNGRAAAISTNGELIVWRVINDN